MITPFDRTPPAPKAEDATPVPLPRVASMLERFGRFMAHPIADVCLALLLVGGFALFITAVLA